MQAKIIDENIEYKVRRLNLDEVIVNYPNEKGFKSYEYKDIELIGESELDEFLINNNNFLAIKLNRGVSAYFYLYLKEAIEEYINDKIEEFVVLKDKYSINKRSIWTKEIALVINYRYLLKIQANGKNFRRDEIKINIDEIDKNQFLDWCNQEISKILKEIERKEIVLSRFGKVLDKLNKNDNNSNENLIE